MGLRGSGHHVATLWALHLLAGCGRIGYTPVAGPDGSLDPMDGAALDLAAGDARLEGSGPSFDAAADSAWVDDDLGDGGVGEPGLADGMVEDAADSGASVPEPVQVTAARVEWTTATFARVAWTATGNALGFGRYELEFKRRPDPSEHAPVVYGPAQLPELGTFHRPDTPGDLVLSATVGGLVPGASYDVVVYAVDHLGAVTGARAGLAAMRDAPTREVVLWDEPPDGGYSVPSTLEVIHGFGVGGGHCLRFVSTCPEGEARCLENLRRQGIAVDASAAASPFDRAYLELSVAYAGDRPSYASTVGLSFRPSSGADVFQIGEVVIPVTREYTSLEVPLRALRNSTRALVPGDVMMSPVYEWSLGGCFQAGAEVRVDRVRIRW
jgi:hypothetical protein